MCCRMKSCFKIYLPLYLFALGLAAECRGQQKAMYTQYLFNGLAINPAYSATDEALTVTMLARQQWAGLQGAPNTQTFSIHSPVKESNTSIGAFLMRDNIGEVLTETGGYLTLAQRIEVGEQAYLAVGFNGGISHNRANYSDNYINSPNSVDDPVFQNQNEMRANFGVGVMFFSPKFYVGVSSPHFYYRDFASLGREAPTTTGYRPQYLLQAGYVATLSDNFKFKPNFLIKYVNGSPVQFDINANLLIKETIWVGASYRSADSFDAIAQIYLSNSIALGYSYDFANTALARVQTGSHEVMLQFRLPVKGRNYPRCYY